MLTELAAAVHRGQVSPRELVEESLRRIDKHNATLNAVVALRADEALVGGRLAQRRPPIGAAWREYRC